MPKKLSKKRSSDFVVLSNGDAFISQRKAAELCGVVRNSIVHFFKGKSDITQGLSDNDLQIVVQHYAKKGRAAALDTLVLFSKAGAKAYIYHNAGYVIAAKKDEVKSTSPQEDRLKALSHLADEFSITGASKLIMFNKGLSEFPALQRALPSYSNDKFTGTVGEVSERVAHAYGFHKRELGFDLSAIAFNKIAIEAGFVKSEVTSGGVVFKSVTKKGLEFGKNVVPKQHAVTTQPHWYDDTIADLYAQLVAE